MHKITLCSFGLFALVSTGFAAEVSATAALTDAPPAKAETIPRGEIVSVIVAKDKRTLEVKYERSGKPFVERFTFPADLTDFRYCVWQYGLGVAVVGRVGAGEKAEYFYGTCYFSRGEAKPHKPVKIKDATGEFPVLGIGSTGGDSVIITAMQHARNRGPDWKETVSGWMWIDNCPLPDAEISVGYLTPLRVVTEQKSVEQK